MVTGIILAGSLFIFILIIMMFAYIDKIEKRIKENHKSEYDELEKLEILSLNPFSFSNNIKVTLFILFSGQYKKLNDPEIDKYIHRIIMLCFGGTFFVLFLFALSRILFILKL